MALSWKHPQFGRFAFDGMAWVGKILAPGFNACSFVPGRDVCEPPDGSYELVFDADSDADLPSPAMLKMVERLLLNQGKLPVVIGEAIWKVFRPDDLAKGFVYAHLEPPTSPTALCRGLRLNQIAVRGKCSGYVDPILELSFWAAYDREHDLGVLTDGEVVRGIGGAADVVPFDEG